MSGPRIYKDAATGKRYELLDLPPGQARMFAPNIVCECTRCRTRFKPEDLARGCPRCSGAASSPPAHYQAFAPPFEPRPAEDERVVMVPPKADPKA